MRAKKLRNEGKKFVVYNRPNTPYPTHLLEEDHIYIDVRLSVVESLLLCFFSKFARLHFKPELWIPA
jgi:hypothetical protein